MQPSVIKLLRESNFLLLFHFRNFQIIRESLQDRVYKTKKKEKKINEENFDEIKRGEHM